MDSSSNGSSTADAPWWRRVAGGADRALDVVFPPTCVECAGLVENSIYRHICETCSLKVLLVREPHCGTCGYPYFGEATENRECPHCEGLSPAFGEGRTATLLQGAVRRLVHGLKYERALYLLDDVVALVRAHAYFRGFLAGARLVPVPLNPRKSRERGYNQSELIAQCFARASGATVVPMLERVVDTATQTRLDRRQRRENLKNAFALVKGAPVIPSVRHVLVDDVFTTGATLNACAVALRRAGVKHLDVATLGHG